MADGEQKTGYDPISLPANSFELSDLRKGLDAAIGVQDREKHPERIHETIMSTAQLPEVLEAATRPAVPAGATATEIEIRERADAEPRKVQAYTFDAAEGAASGGEAAAMETDGRAAAIAGADAPTANARNEADWSTETRRSGSKKKQD